METDSMSPRELGIPFSTPLVRAIRNTKPGVWPAEPIDPAKVFKWQTRRLIRWKPREAGLNVTASSLESGPYNICNPQSGFVLRSRGHGSCWNDRTYPLHPQYGYPGSRLYVKEALRPSGSRITVYQEDDCPAWRDGESVTWPWKVSAISARYMPRWAARIHLEVKRVRVERLEAISEEDARAEGLALEPCTHPDCGPGTRCAAGSYRGMFAVTWNKLHAKEAPWGSGVWVAVYDFAVLSSNEKEQLTNG
jgi:hypothetical protein